MSAVPSIGFLGLGEAGASIAGGLAGAGAPRVRAYDAAAGDPERGAEVRRRAENAAVTLVDETGELVRTSDVVLSLVTSTVAVDVAADAAAHLRPGQVYVDLNSAEPAQMDAVAAVVEPTGAAFVDGAIMAAVPPHGHRVPILLSGPGAERTARWLTTLGGRVDVLSDVPGAASATKLSRSLVIKGLEAVLWEAAMVAEHYGEAERVLESLGDTLPGDGWNDFAGYLLGRTVLHGERRAHEMEGVARMLEAIGMEPHMATASARRLEAVVAGLGPDRSPARLPTAAAGLARAAREGRGGAAADPAPDDQQTR